MRLGGQVSPNMTLAKIACVVLLVPLACSRQDHVKSDLTLSDYIDVPGGAAGQKIAYDQAEAVVATCMKLEGFDYRAVNPLRNGSIQMGPSEQDFGSREFRKVHGFGIADSRNPPQISSNPNSDYVDSLSSGDRAKYDALLGASSDTQPAGFESCRTKAYRAIDVRGKVISELSGSLYDLQVKIQNDKRTGQIRLKWKECMQKQGFPVVGISQLYQDLTERAQKAEGEALVKARADEITASLADFDCSQKTREETLRIRRTYEEEFIERNKSVLEKARPR